MDAAMTALIEREKKELAGDFCRGCGYCMPCPAGIEINQLRAHVADDSTQSVGGVANAGKSSQDVQNRGLQKLRRLQEKMSVRTGYADAVTQES